jgi:antirestriction protein
MHENTPQDGEHEEETAQPEREREERPRIYVASLADYNEGRLHGKWIDAAQKVDELKKSIDEMLNDSPSPGAEEWAIHDYEGFGLLHVHEFEALEDIAKVAAGIVAHGPAFAAWASRVGADSEALDWFEDYYLGDWESPKAFVEYMLDELGEVTEIARCLPDHLGGYFTFDYNGYLDDLVSGDEVIVLERPGGGVYVFQSL